MILLLAQLLFLDLHVLELGHCIQILHHIPLDHHYLGDIDKDQDGNSHKAVKHDPKVGVRGLLEVHESI